MDTSKKFCVWKPSLTSLSGGFLLRKLKKITEWHVICIRGFVF